MALALISTSVRRDRTRYATEFRQAKPFPHLVIDGFFQPAFCDELLRTFPPFERGCSLNEMGHPGRKSTIEDLRSIAPAYARADDLFASSGFAGFMSELTGIPELLYDPAYIGGGTHENRPGQELDPHLDFNYHPHRGWHRRLNLIVYLNPEWHEAWGGSLEIHEDPWLPPDRNRVRRILPIANRAVVFETSERSWHGFEAILPPPGRPDVSRKSLAIYLYTTERPAAETAPSHSTVYVDRPLPGVLRSGERLSERDATAIVTLLSRRMQHVQFLTEREKRFTSEAIELVGRVLRAAGRLDDDDIARIRALAQRQDDLLRVLYQREKDFNADLCLLRRRVEDPLAMFPLAGNARLARSACGYFPTDRWAGPVLELEVVAEAPIERVAVRGHVPDLVGSQTIECTVDHATAARVVAAGDFEITVPVRIAAGERTAVHVRASRSIKPAELVPGSPDVRHLSYLLGEVEIR